MAAQTSYARQRAALGRESFAAWNGYQQAAGLSLIILAAEFMTVIMLAASMAPSLNLGRGAISDLGVIAETAALFNGSLILIGALNILAGSFLCRSGLGRWSTTPFLLGGLGAVGAGLVPLDKGDLHGLFALAAFVLFNVEAIVAARLARGPMRAISIMSGVIGLLFVALMVVGDSGNPAVFGPIGHGGAERMIVYPVMLWMLVFGGYLIGPRDHGPHREPA
jgi:hypothetical membrane protein